MHLSYREKLYKYLILNIINFYLFPLEKKGEFFKIKVRIKVKNVI